MCGIAGIYNNNSHSSILREQSRNMLDVARHRGPDDQGIYAIEYCSIGMNRLSIIDLKSGHQPIASSDGRYQLVCNGEIYNYCQLREEMRCKGYRFKTQTDVEVILPLFIFYGLKGFERLDGMFSFAILDTKISTLYLCRDRFGIKPLYYFKTESGVLLFASEIKSILKIIQSREIEIDVLADFIITGYSEDGYSVWKGVKILPPGYCCIKNQEKEELHNYISLEEEENYTDKEIAKKALREAVIQDIEAQLISDVPLGVFLSGGVDSSIILGVINKILGEKYPAFSIDFSDSDYSESEKFKSVAKEYNAEHYVFTVNENLLDYTDEVITACDEPFGDMASLPTYLLSLYTVKKVKVVISGDGSDEYMYGYVHNSHKNSKKDFLKNQYLHKITMALPLIHPKQYSVLSRTNNNSTGRPQNLYHILREKIFCLKRNNTTNKVYYSLTDHDRDAYLPNDILYKTDRMSMFCSLETRVPFLGNHSVSVAKRIPKEFQVSRVNQKVLLINAFNDILPEKIRNQRKHGFTVPAGEWIKKRYDVNRFKKIITESSLSVLYNTSMIDKIINEHYYNHFNHGKFLYRLYIASIWCEKYQPIVNI